MITITLLGSTPGRTLARAPIPLLCAVIPENCSQASSTYTFYMQSLRRSGAVRLAGRGFDGADDDLGFCDLRLGERFGMDCIRLWGNTIKRSDRHYASDPVRKDMFIHRNWLQRGVQSPKYRFAPNTTTSCAVSVLLGTLPRTMNSLWRWTGNPVGFCYRTGLAAQPSFRGKIEKSRPYVNA